MGDPPEGLAGRRSRPDRAEPAVVPVVIRVLGLPSHESALLRADTPLAGLGVDSLALVLIADALSEHGWHTDMTGARRAVTIGDLAACCTVAPEAR